MGKSKDLGADGRADLRVVLERSILDARDAAGRDAAGRDFFFAMMLRLEIGDWRVE